MKVNIHPGLVVNLVRNAMHHIAYNVIYMTSLSLLVAIFQNEPSNIRHHSPIIKCQDLQCRCFVERYFILSPPPTLSNKKKVI